MKTHNIQKYWLTLAAPAVLGLSFYLLVTPEFTNAESLGSAFTYNGRLVDGGSPANGRYDLRFGLFSLSSAGLVVGNLLTNANVDIENGLFTASLDFGRGVFDGTAYWLEIGVRANGSITDFTTLGQRQLLTPTPYALYALNASGVTSNAINGNQSLELRVNGVRGFRLEPNFQSPNLIGGYSGNNVSSGADIGGATIAGGGGLDTINGPGGTTLLPNRVTESYATVGGGLGNESGGYAADIGGGYKNSSGGVCATLGGGYQNNASGNFATIAGGWLNTANGVSASIGGGSQNSSSGGNSTIGGGATNVATADYATVGGGVKNTAGDAYTTVGGGYYNTASKNSSTVSGGANNIASDNSSTVGGGAVNTAAGPYATVGGGYYNTANTTYASVAGGYLNTASGLFATVPGGSANVASGNASFAAGQFARAVHDRSFIWSSYGSYASTFQSDTFFVSAANGIGINCGAQRPDGGGQYWMNLGNVIGGDLIETSTGAHLTTAGVWANASDKNRKTDFAPVSARQILEKLSGLPLRQWRYTNELSGVRHLGPTAQDFKSAFGLGMDDKSIGTVDEEGVALAAIQGLNQKLEEKDAKLAELEQRVMTLEKLLSRAASENDGGER